ncbi:MAG: glycosyltransferase family 1 protein [Deinococcaceae bacterium]
MILYDNRWKGNHGIGRFAREVKRHLSHLHTLDSIERGPHPLSIQDPVWLSWRIKKSPAKAYFNPGFNVPLWSEKPFVFTIHDLIHLHVPEERSRAKTLYYERLIRPQAKRAYKILTVSAYSKQRILEWTNLQEDRVSVVGNGVNEAFCPNGRTVDLGFDYVLCVSNPKPHKNLPRLLKAWSLLKTDIRLAFTGVANPQLMECIKRDHLAERVIFLGHIPEVDLPTYYRSAAAVILPSTYEGFGLPPLEGMACGVPVVVANATSLPEVVGDAGLLFDPLSSEAIAYALERILTDSDLRKQCIQKGLERATDFSWIRVARNIHTVLESIGER